MALEVAEGAVVADDLEAVAQRLEPAARAVAAVAALADQVAQRGGALLGVERADGGQGAFLGGGAVLEEQGGEQLLLVAVDVQQPNARPVLDGLGAVEPQPGGPALAGGAPLLELADPFPAATARCCSTPSRP